MTPRLTAIAAALACAFASGNAQANGTDPTVVAGQASFSTLGTSLNVSNSPGAIINWQGFSIGAGETTRFIQQSAASSVLNRVIGPDPSFILGTLASNGRVFLVNPSGILFGQGARVDVAGLVASTLNLSNQDFLAGRFNLTPNALAGKVENQGSITTPSGGSVYLVGSNVTNSGIISSPQGDVILAAGQSVKIFDTSTPGVRVELTASDNAAVNLGKILAQSGQVGIYGAALRNSGIIDADQVVRDASGKIVLRAKQDVTLEAGGRLSANGAQGGAVTVQSETGRTLVSGAVEAKGTQGEGGTIKILGNQVGLIDSASVNASGQTGGGTVLVGGDFHGANSNVQNATATYVGPDATIKAEAIQSGNGGNVAVWADDTTRYYGNISARGGANSGDGGFVEVSGKHYLDFGGMVDTRAPLGQAGTLLLDPDEIQIINAAGGATLAMTCTGGGNCTTPSGSGPYTDTAAAYFAPAFTVGILPDNSINQQLAFGNVTVKTSLDGILISNVSGTVAIGPVTGTTDVDPGAVPGPNANTLTLDSATDISWNAAWSYKNFGQLTLLANGGSIAGTGALTLVEASPVLLQATTNIGLSGTPIAISGNGGNVTISAGSSVELSIITSGAGTISATSSGTGDLTISGALTTTNSGTSSVVLDSTSGTGNVISSGGSISTLGRATIFTNTVAGSTGVEALVGSGSGNFRYNSVTTGLGATGTYAVYTEQPFLTVTANNASKVYGTDDPAQGYASVTGYVNGDTDGLTGSYARTAGESVGNRSITQGTVASNVGYGITFTSGQNLTITKASLTAAIPNQTKTYGADDPAVGTITPSLTGLVNDPAIVTWNGTVGVDDSALTSTTTSLVRAVGEDVGVRNITAGVFSAASANYSAPSFTGAPTLSITPRTANLAATRNYDGTTNFAGGAFTPTITGTVANTSWMDWNGNMTTVVGAQTLTIAAGGTGTVPSRNAGPAQTLTTGAIVLADGGNGGLASNYTLTGGTHTGTITRAPLTLSTSDVTKTYDGNTSAASTAIVTSGTLYDSLTDGTFAFTDKSVGINNKTVITTGVTVNDGNSGGNYIVSYADNTTSTITALGITGSITAATKIYDATEVATITGRSLSGAIGGDDVSYSGGVASFDTKNAGTGKTITGTGLVLAGADAGNYTVNGAATTQADITPAPLDITANSETRQYGDANPAFSATYAGFKSGETTAALTGALVFATPAVPYSNAGNYAIIPSGQSSTNYTISYVNGTLSVTPVSLMITADAKSKIYGTSDPALTFGVTGLVNNPALGIADTAGTVLSGALTRVFGETVAAGPYAITQGTLAPNSNYTLSSFTSNGLTITPAPLNVAANPQSKLFGKPDPALTFSVTGLVNNPALGIADTAVSVLSGALTRVPGESALGGPYAITQGSLASNGNYTLGFTPNNLIIIGAAVEPIVGFDPEQVIFAGVVNNEFYYRPGNFWHISLNPNNADPGFDVMRGTNDLNSRLRRSTSPCDSVTGGGFCETWSFPQQREKVDNE